MNFSILSSLLLTPLALPETLLFLARSLVHVGSLIVKCDSFHSTTDNGQSVVKPVNGTLISVCEDTTLVVTPARVACLNSDSEWTICQLILQLLHICKIIRGDHVTGEDSDFIFIMLAFLITTSVRIVFVCHGSMITNEIPVILHPSTLTAIGAIGLSELFIVMFSVCGTVNSLLLR